MQTKDTTTANGALSHSTTGSAIVDFFGKGAALRNQPESEVLRYFSAAMAEDPVLAIKVLFYLGDIRGGQGERKLWRVCFRALANGWPFAEKLIPLVPEYRRWDDVLESLDGTPLENDAISLLVEQLDSDDENEKTTLTLAAKWAPSEQASSSTTKRLASKVRKAMELSPREYRKLLSRLRNRIKVVERDMSANQWENIEFSHVPSKAAKNYKDAFIRHQPERYKEFLSKVEKGEVKINASTLYPYDIVREIMGKEGDSAKTLELQWKALPNYLEDNPHVGLVVADVSGSMTMGGSPKPIEVCLSLAIYFAERNVGPFKDYFLTFSNNSKLQQLIGKTLKEKIANLNQAEWGMSTNLQSSFQAILGAAKRDKVAPEFMPQVVYIISDMQFNVAVSDNSLTNLEAIKKQYEQAGYALPRIVFWCVNAYGDTPVKVNETGVCLVSGCSPSILKTVLSGEVMTPMDVVLQAVNVPRYQAVEDALK